MIGPRVARTSALAAVVATLMVASPARADLTIAAPSCAELDVREMQRLLELELAEVASQWSEGSPPVVLLGCAGERVRIEITDPITDKSVARTIVWPAEDRERVLALAVAQLFVTSWLELLIEEPAEHAAWADAAERIARGAVEEAQAEPEPQPEPEPETTPPSEIVPEPVPEPVPGRSPPSIDSELSLEGGTRVRFEGESLATAAAALRGALVIDDSIVVALRLGTEYARTARMRGDIDAYTVTLGVGAAWRTPRVGPFSLDVGAWVSGMWLALEGRPASPDVQGGTTIAIAAEASIELAPSLSLGPVIVSLPLGVGVIAFAPDGEVSEEPPVVIGGSFFSAALRVAIVPSHF